MKRSCVTRFVLALAIAGQAAAINPPLKDVSSDKKFFGPPFPADYPDDKRPVVQKHVLDKLKGPDQPYPALQSKSKFDSDFVKDENGDKGAWEAQFEYDALRKKLAKEEADERRAQEAADGKDRDVDKAQKDADEAAKKAGDAQKDVDDAKAGEGAAKKENDEFGGPPSAEKLDALKKKLAEAEANYEKEKKEFEECQKQLDEAKKLVETLKAQQEEMEKKLAEETKLWVEEKTVKLNLKKSKQAAAASAAASKQKAADDRLATAKAKKADVDKKLAKEKAEHEEAQKNLQKEKQEFHQAKEDLKKATAKLQKLGGYKPAAPEAHSHSGATMATTALSLVMALSAQFL